MVQYTLRIFCFITVPQFQTFPLAAFFGGVTLTDLNTVVEVKSVGLSYFLDQTEEWMIEVGDEWERGFLDDLQTLGKIYAPNLEVGLSKIACHPVFRFWKFREFLREK